MRIGEEAAGGGSILLVGISVPCSNTACRHLGLSIRHATEKRARVPNGAEWYPRSGEPSHRWTQDDTLQWLTSGDKAPERDDQFACQRDDHGLARANTAIGGAGAIPQGQCALLLKPQKAPGELDHAAAGPGVAGSGETLFAPLRAALVRRARQAGVAGHGSAVTHGPRQHLIDEHVCRFNADADDPG